MPQNMEPPNVHNAVYVSEDPHWPPDANALKRPQQITTCIHTKRNRLLNVVGGRMGYDGALLKLCFEVHMQMCRTN